MKLSLYHEHGLVEDQNFSTSDSCGDMEVKVKKNY